MSEKNLALALIVSPKVLAYANLTRKPPIDLASQDAAPLNLKTAADIAYVIDGNSLSCLKPLSSYSTPLGLALLTFKQFLVRFNSILENVSVVMW